MSRSLLRLFASRRRAPLRRPPTLEALEPRDAPAVAAVQPAVLAALPAFTTGAPPAVTPTTPATPAATDGQTTNAGGLTIGLVGVTAAQTGTAVNDATLALALPSSTAAQALQSLLGRLGPPQVSVSSDGETLVVTTVDPATGTTTAQQIALGLRPQLSATPWTSLVGGGGDNRLNSSVGPGVGAGATATGGGDEAPPPDQSPVSP
jgi:hypothetical protein